MAELAQLFDAHIARDPTQTFKLRKAFRATAKIRLRQLRVAMRAAVVDHNILGFSRVGSMSFHPPEVRLKAFSGWLGGVGGQILLGDAWARTYIMRAWHAGAVKAIREIGAVAPGPDRSDAIIALARIEIEGILSVTVQQVTRQAASIIARNTRKQRALRQLFTAFDKVAQPRLVVMCDVLSIKAYNEAKLGTYQSNGVRRVGVQSEHLPGRAYMTSYRIADRDTKAEEEALAEEEQLVGILTAGDDKVCELCEDWAEDSPYEIEEVRDVYPLHPRCRCAVYPWEDLRYKGDAAYDPSEPRDERGRWTFGGGGASVTIGDRSVHIVKSKLDRDNHLVLLDVPKFDVAFAREHEAYIGPGGTGNAIRTRYPDFEKFLEGRDSIEASTISVSESGRIDFVNGRHRYAVMRDQGVTQMPAVVTRDTVKFARKFGYLARTDEHATPDQRTQRHWFSRDPDDAFVYHGTDAEHLPGIQKEGLQSFLRNYFATDPKVAMQYGYRPNLHHPSESAKRPGVLLRVHKQHVDPQAWKSRSGNREDFWTGPSDIPIDQIEVRHDGEWKKLSELGGVRDGFDDKYDPNEPREPAGTSIGGQWTSMGGGGGHEFVSPNIESGGDPKTAIATAVKNIRSSRQKALHRASREIDDALGLASLKHSAVGAWKDGAEHTIVSSIEGDPDWEKMRVSAAMQGHLADQKQVLVFKQEDAGTSALYHMSVKTDDLGKLHEELIQDGLAFHTVVPHTEGGGADVVVADLDGSAHDAMAKAAERHNAHVTYERGKAEFIGTTKEDGTDREQRDDARRIYQEVIEQSPIQASKKIWKGVHNSWGEALGVAPPVVENQWGAEEGLVPSRKSSSKKIRSEGYARPDVASMRTDPEAYEHNVDVFEHADAYPNFRPGELTGKTTDQKVRTIIEHMKANLRFLYANAGDTVLASGSGWYDKARDLAIAAGKRYGINERAAAGVIATLSPQKDWNQNIYLAHAVMEINHSHRNEKWSDDPEMVKTAARIWKDKDREVVERVQDKTLGELTDPVEKAVWIRTYDEAHSDRTYHDFDTGELVTKKGKKAGTREPSRAAWQSIPAIANAVMCLDSNGDLDVISEALGSKHKVRSFYNNIAAPRAPNGDVTIDTHAVGVALLRPLSGKTIPVMHGLGTNPQRPPGKRGKDWTPPEGWVATSKSIITGLSGTYAIYADAYREVAAELGVLPQQLQAVTWQAKRILFAGGPLKRAAVEREWVKYRDGAQTLEQTQQAVLTLSRAAPGDVTEEEEDED